MNSERGRLGRYIEDARTLPGDLRLAWRLEGWRGAVLEIKDRTLHRVYRRGRFLLFEQELESLRLPPIPSGVTIRELTLDDLPEMRGVLTQRKLAKSRELFERGRICLGAWLHGALCGYTWISTRMEADAEFYTLDLPADAVYMWDLFVLPAVRGAGIGSALVGARLEHARALGYKKAWRMVSPSNRPSMRTFHKSAQGGFTLIGEMRSIKILSRAYTRLRPVPPGAVRP